MVATFLKDDGGIWKLADGGTDFLVVGSFERKASDGVKCVCIKARGYDEIIGGESFDGRNRFAGEGLLVFFERGSIRQDDVHIVSLACAFSHFGRVATEIGKVMSGITVYGHSEDVGILIKNILRAIAVVKVDIEDGDSFTGGKKFSGAAGGVVEVAISAVGIEVCVMPRWAAKGVGKSGFTA